MSSEIPLILLPDQTPEEMFGYRPEYVPNVPTFDSENRPYLRSRTVDLHRTEFVQTLRDGAWVEREFISAIEKAYPEFDETVAAGGTSETRVVFDSDDRCYTALSIRLKDGSRRNVMLVSEDYGESWMTVELPPGAVVAEHRAGPNELDGPPFLMISTRIAGHDDRWASQNRLSVSQPKWKDGEVVVPEPIEVSDKLISLGQHSGGAPFAVSREGKTHFTWIELAEEEDAPGTPTFAATYDHDSGAVSSPVFLAYAPPRNNSHNRPGIVMDSDGYLHVVTGSHHGENFYYTRSKEPNDTQSGWAEPKPVWDRGWTALSGDEAGGQTYVSLVCDPDDTLHLVFRHWQKGTDAHPHFPEGGMDQMATLSYQRMLKDGEWSEPATLVVPARTRYAIYYQKLAIDRAGGLYLSFSYFDRELSERSDRERFYKNMVLTSRDRGETWRFATTADFE